MDSAELLQTIARVRRAMPRNGDVLAICDALESRLCTLQSGMKINAPGTDLNDGSIVDSYAAAKAATFKRRGKATRSRRAKGSAKGSAPR